MRFLKFVISISICFLPGVIGGIATSQSLYPWYDILNKPFFTPPDWIFSPVWTVLYILMGISLYFVLIKPINLTNKTRGLAFFGTQLALNAIWPIVFFGFHLIFGGLVLILALFFFIALSFLEFYKISKPAAYLLIPYLLWVGFAAILNFSIFAFN